MSGVAGWLLFLGSVLVAAWFATDVVRLTCPHLTPRQRWAVVWYLTVTASSASIAWRLA